MKNLTKAEFFLKDTIKQPGGQPFIPMVRPIRPVITRPPGNYRVKEKWPFGFYSRFSKNNSEVLQTAHSLKN